MKKKIVAMCATVALAAMAVGGTLAWFTDEASVENTFTVGNVEILLDEAVVNEYGEDQGGRTDEQNNGNAYKLIPGQEYVKDPTVTVVAGSEPCYVRMLVTVSDIAKLKAAFPSQDYSDWYAGNIFLLQKLVTGWDGNVWECVSATEAGKYEFRYVANGGIIDARGGVKELEALFETIVIPDEIDYTALSNLQGVQIDVEAHAIQSTNLTDEDAAWSAFDEQMD